MAREIVTIQVMPESPDVEVAGLQDEVLRLVTDFVAEESVETRVEVKPVAFGLELLEVKFVRPEGVGDLEKLCAGVEGIEGVRSCEVTDMRRAIG